MGSPKVTMSFVWPELPELRVADFGLGQLAMSSDTDSDTDDEMPALEEKFQYLNEYDSGARLYFIPAPESKWLIVHPTANLQRERNTFRAAQLWKVIRVSDVLTHIGTFYSAGITIERPVAEAPQKDDCGVYLEEMSSVPDFARDIYLESEYERQLQKMRDAMDNTMERLVVLALASGTATALHLEIMENLQLAATERKAARSDLLASKDA